MLLSSIISILLLSGPAKQTPGDSVYIHETSLHFRWDKSNYEDTYLQNADAAEKLCNFLEQLGPDRIDSLSVVAYASPEGVYEHNIKLSRERAKQFRIAMQQRMAMEGLDIKLRVRPGGEAWGPLRQRVAEDTAISDVARERILKVLDDDSVGNDTKKWRMMHNALGATPQEGDVYHWLLINHYRYLRCLHIQIYTRDSWVRQALGLEEPLIPASEPESPADSTAVATPEEMPDQAGHEEETAGHDTTALIPATEPLIPASTEPLIPASEPLIPATEPESPADSTAVATPEEMPDQAGHEEKTAGQNEWMAIPDQPTAPAKGTPVIGLSTNILYDATYLPHYGFTSIPSFSLEYYPAGGNWTYGADVEWSHWLHYPEHRFNQIHNITLHTRRYFNSGEDGFRGLYLLGSLNATQYGLGWDEHGWEGEGIGLSAGIGHKWNWGRFFIDLGASVGAFYSIYDPYVWGNDATGWYYYDYAGDPSKFIRRNNGWFLFAPTRLQVSVGFDLFNRRK